VSEILQPSSKRKARRASKALSLIYRRGNGRGGLEKGIKASNNFRFI
jgi:hypothetical protein